MRFVLPLILSACVVAEGAAPRPVGMVWSEATTYCDEEGVAYTPSVPGAIVQAAACADGACWSVVWTDRGDGYMDARCQFGADRVEWTWITPIR